MTKSPRRLSQQVKDTVGEQVRDLPLHAVRLAMFGVGRALRLGDRLARDYKEITEGGGVKPVVERLREDVQHTTEKVVDLVTERVCGEEAEPEPEPARRTRPARPSAARTSEGEISVGKPGTRTRPAPRHTRPGPPPKPARPGALGRRHVRPVEESGPVAEPAPKPEPAEPRPEPRPQAEPAPSPEAAEPKPWAPGRPEPAEPEETKPEPAKPEAAEPETAEPEPAQPEETKPEPAKPEAAEPEAAEPETAEPEPAQPEEAKPEPSTEVEPASSTEVELSEPTDEATRQAVARDEQAFEPRPEAKPAAPAEAERVAADLPVPDYDSATLPQLRARLRGLSVEQVKLLREYERKHAARENVIRMYERRIAKLNGLS